MDTELPTLATVGVATREVPRLKSMSPNCEWRQTVGTVLLQVLPAKVPRPVSESPQSPWRVLAYIMLVPVVDVLSRSILWMPLIPAGIVT